MSKLKYGMATAGAIAAFAGVAALSLPQVLAGEHMGTSQAWDDGTEQQSQEFWITQRAKNEYAIQMQECDTLKNSQAGAYEPCMEKARSTRNKLLAQTRGSEDTGQGSQGSALNQSQQQFSGQKQGPIDKMTSAVKETVAEVKEKFFGSNEGREGQASAGQQQGDGSGQGRGVAQGQNPLQQGFEARHMQGQDMGAGSGRGGQNFGQQGPTQGQQQGQSGQGSFQGGDYGQQSQGQSGQQGMAGTNQQFQGQQGPSGQGSFQGGNYGQQAQGQPCPQGTGGTNQQFQSGGPQGHQGSNDQVGSTSGSVGPETEHMNAAEYYKVLARQQYATLQQECNTLKQDPSVYEQCQQHAQSVRDKIVDMADQG